MPKLSFALLILLLFCACKSPSPPTANTLPSPRTSDPSSVQPIDSTLPSGPAHASLPPPIFKPTAFEEILLPSKTEKIFGLAVESLKGSVKLTVLSSSGLLRSENNGQSWSELEGKEAVRRGFPPEVLGKPPFVPDSLNQEKWPKSLAKYTIESVWQDPQQPQIWYAFKSHTFYHETGAVYKSLDNGETWQTLDLQLGHTFYVDFWLDPVQTDTLYLLQKGEGILRSQDGGKTWKSWSRDFLGFYEIPGGIQQFFIMPDLPGRWIFSPHHPDQVFHRAAGLLYHSQDHGKTFQRFPAPPAYITTDVQFSKQPEALYVGTEKGVFLWDGLNWQPLNQNLYLANVHQLQPHPTHPENIWGISDRQVFQFAPHTGQISWGEAVPAEIHQLLIEPHPPFRFYVASAEGLYMSENRGQSWQRDEELFIEGGRGYTTDKNRYVSWIAFHPEKPGEIWAGISDHTVTLGLDAPAYNADHISGAIFYKTPGAQIWKSIVNAQQSLYPYQFELYGAWFLPSEYGKTLFLSIVGNHFNGLYRSYSNPLENLSKWKNFSNSALKNRTIQKIVPTTKEQYYALGLKGELLKGNIDPESWTFQGQIPGCNAIVDLPLYTHRPLCSTLLVDPAHQEHLLAGARDGLWQSLDSGKNWQKIESSPERIISLLQTPQKLYIGTEKGLFVSQIHQQ